jgi:hypothetical protein
MPEGPGILLTAERFVGAVGGRKAEQVRFGLPRLRCHGARLSGRGLDAWDKKACFTEVR